MLYYCFAHFNNRCLISSVLFICNSYMRYQPEFSSGLCQRKALNITYLEMVPQRLWDYNYSSREMKLRALHCSSSAMLRSLWAVLLKDKICHRRRV